MASSRGKRRSQGKRRRFSIVIKLFIMVAVIVVSYGIWLDSQIRHRVEGQVWQLPAAVYGRIANLEAGMPYGIKQMQALLEGAQYRLVSKITRPGEFTVNADSIELLRRPFDFPDSKEEQIRAQLRFHEGTLTEIKNLDTGRLFGFFRLDPRLITMMQSPNGEQRLFVPRAGFPSLLVDTLIATEDRHFYQHDGISLYSIGRAVLANVTAGKLVQGGSTLTQQLVKNLFLSNERSLWRKLREAYMALIMDARYSKDRILELYLNEVYLGQTGGDQIHGFPLASLYYFGRPVNELSLDQQALLVGMVKGPSFYNPWRNPTLALERRNLVLRLLQNQKIIDQELYDMLSARPLGVEPKGGVITPQPAFMQLVRNELQQKLQDKLGALSGAKIFTTLDPVSQDAAEQAVVATVPTFKKKRGLSDLESAAVIVDRVSGEVRAMVGGSEPHFAGYNRALQARRSIGSLAKPATYLTALEQPGHYRLSSVIADEPLTIKMPGGKVWQPQNDNRQFSGSVMLVDALTNSMNVPTVNLGMTLGLDNVVQTWKDLGAPASELKPMPAILLGALNLTPFEVAQAFQTIAAGGNRASLSALRSVIGEDGTIFYQSFPQAQRVKSAQASYLTAYALQQVVQRGTARTIGARFPNATLAGKTGTTNNLIDSWFAGIDGKEVTVIWVGRDNNQTSKLYGSSGAMQVYRRYLENQAPTPLLLTPPENIVQLPVDRLGNVLCSAGGQDVRKLPIWTLDGAKACQQAEQVSSITTPMTEKRDQDGVADWIRELFGNKE